jgi:hypothetical protein
MVYLIPLQVRRFKNKNPDQQVFAAGATKARKMASESRIRFEPGWITSRRAALILTNDRLVCGSWEIPLTSIVSADLLRFRSLFGGGCVLKISTDSDHYQFGLQYDPAWEEQTALKVTVTDEKIEYSIFSIVLRIIVLIILVRYILDLVT